MESDEKITLFIATSLDGYIARKNGDIVWLSTVETPGEDYGYGDFIKSIDTVIMGRKTYDKILSFGIDFPHKNKSCFIITRKPRPSENNIEFYSGEPDALIKRIRNKGGKNIFIDGGAQIVNEFMKRDLIDFFIISIIPVFLGSGISLFQEERPEIKLQLLKCKNFRSGLVQLTYERKR